MQSTIHCTCGYTRSGRDEEELYSLIRGHIDRSHPERHQLIVREEFGSLVPHDNDHPYPSHLLTAGRASSSPQPRIGLPGARRGASRDHRRRVAV